MKNRLSDLQKALLLYMAVKGLAPDGEFQSCHSVVTGFIKQYGNFFCDSIDKTREALYSLAHKWEFSHPYVENGGDVGVLYEDKDGILRQTEGANMRYVRCRLSITGLNYVNKGNFMAHFERRKHVPCFMCLIKDNYEE